MGMPFSSALLSEQPDMISRPSEPAVMREPTTQTVAVSAAVTPELRITPPMLAMARRRRANASLLMGGGARAKRSGVYSTRKTGTGAFTTGLSSMSAVSADPKRTCMPGRSSNSPSRILSTLSR